MILKQKRFVKNYRDTGNASEAARKGWLKKAHHNDAFSEHLKN